MELKKFVVESTVKTDYVRPTVTIIEFECDVITASSDFGEWDTEM